MGKSVKYREKLEVYDLYKQQALVSDFGALYPTFLVICFTAFGFLEYILKQPPT
jgi:hypothetical protein